MSKETSIRIWSPAGYRKTLFVVLSLLVSTVYGAAQSLKTEFFQGQEVVANEVLVRFKSTPAISIPAVIAQMNLTEDIDSTSAIGAGDVWKFHSRSKDVAALIRDLSVRPEVAYAEPDFIGQALVEPNDPSFENLWGLHNTGQVVQGVPGKPGADISAVLAWNISTGSKANMVAVVDTGIDYNHPDLAANVWSAPTSFTVNIGATPITCPAGSHGFNAITLVCDPYDDNHHGTHVSGTIGALGNNQLGVVGVNWTASIMGAKWINSSGYGSTADAINAIEFVVQTKARFGSAANVRVLNNSWRIFGFSQALLDEINRANDNDMLFVAAAGNDYGNNNDVNPVYPASYKAPNVIAVAATDNTDARAVFSNLGASSVHLGAPGKDVYSTWPGSSYAFDSGTSMATPHVSGAAALVLSSCALNTASLKADILNNVDPIPSMAGITVTGGRLDVNKAISACASDFLLTVTPIGMNKITVKGFRVTVTAIGRFNGTVALSCFRPDGACSLNPTTIVGSGTSLLTGSEALLDWDGATVTGTSGGLTRQVDLSYSIVPPCKPGVCQ